MILLFQVIFLHNTWQYLIKVHNEIIWIIFNRNSKSTLFAHTLLPKCYGIHLLKFNAWKLKKYEILCLYGPKISEVIQLKIGNEMQPIMVAWLTFTVKHNKQLSIKAVIVKSNNLQHWFHGLPYLMICLDWWRIPADWRYFVCIFLYIFNYKITEHFTLQNIYFLTKR